MDMNIPAGNYFLRDDKKLMYLSDCPLQPELSPKIERDGFQSPSVEVPYLNSISKLSDSYLLHQPEPEPPATKKRKKRNCCSTTASSTTTTTRAPKRFNFAKRARGLSQLLPWDQWRKASSATTLEEAKKYIRFLEAQVTALQTMPTISTIAEHNQFFFPSIGSNGGSSSSSTSGNNNATSASLSTSTVDSGFLEMLGRQQLLQVLLSSDAVQDLLYSKGMCIFSSEQVKAIKRIVEEKRVQQQQEQQQAEDLPEESSTRV